MKQLFSVHDRKVCHTSPSFSKNQVSFRPLCRDGVLEPTPRKTKSRGENTPVTLKPRPFQNLVNFMDTNLLRNRPHLRAASHTTVSTPFKRCKEFKGSSRSWRKEMEIEGTFRSFVSLAQQQFNPRPTSRQTWSVIRPWRDFRG
jgi:hypothetical protein